MSNHRYALNAYRNATSPRRCRSHGSGRMRFSLFSVQGVAVFRAVCTVGCALFFTLRFHERARD
eukprot:scaffold14948_cov60-Phaeocystis_antarctica.AAC.6